MWRTTGGKEVKTITQAKNDDEWETDADFVVSEQWISHITSSLGCWIREQVDG